MARVPRAKSAGPGKLAPEIFEYWSHPTLIPTPRPARVHCPRVTFCGRATYSYVRPSRARNTPSLRLFLRVFCFESVASGGRLGASVIAML